MRMKLYTRLLLFVCKNNKKAYKLTKDRLLIECGIDKDSQRKINSWKNLLPAEMKAEILFTREYWNTAKFQSIEKYLKKDVDINLVNFHYLERNDFIDDTFICKIT